MMNDRSRDPLPRDLLPESELEDDPVLWENRLQGLMSEASPILARYRGEPVTWWSLLADWLRPPRLVAAVAAAAVLTVAVHLALPNPRESTESSLPLATVVGAEGGASALWSVAAKEDDPALALVILEGQTP